jgi:AcrR family transcriptional regulator
LEADVMISEQPARPLRRDAARNQQRVLDAARQALAEHGTDATIEQIAALAGVGVGTVYRRFPAKEALVDALLTQIMDELLAAADIELARGDGNGLERFLFTLGRSLAGHRAYADLLVGHDRTESGADKLRRRISDLTEQAATHGLLAPGIGLGDVMTAIWALRGVIETSGGATSTGWQRFLDLHLAALRDPSWHSAHPAITVRQLNRINSN